MDNTAQAARSSRATLTLAALGVVYGDIGTSPLYAVKETFNPTHGIPLNVESILGGLSTIFWSLMVVVTLKYVVLVMRADNRGEGGIMALVALASSAVKGNDRWRIPILLIGVFGASLFYGDAVLTPAISVLSAVEGLEIGTAALKPYVVPISVGVVIALFIVQSKGTAIVGTLFGPICALWFLSLGVVGVFGIAANPGVLAALHPAHALHFATHYGWASFIVLGAVLLAFTGAEALYADMGHFGSGPIRIAWFGLVFPALMLNYFGQGALLMAAPGAIENPFYLAYPQWALFPMIVLATMATVIASQATISGAYSMTKQAIQLGFLPRMNILQTSEREIGQIYIPAVNWLLLAAVLAAVLGFGSSTRLASAYGVAVMGTMITTTVLTFFVVRYHWRYPLALCALATGLFLAVDLAFFGASLLKILEGGWFPLATGATIFFIMVTWRQGRQILLARLREQAVPLDAFLESLLREPPHRVPGTAVFLTATPAATPSALLHNLKHNAVLHENVVFLTVEILEVPWAPFEERVAIEPLGHNCWRAAVTFGFKDRTDVPHALRTSRARAFDLDPMRTSYFLSRESVIATAGAGMAPWRERIFAALARNAGSAADYFHLPANRVIELGSRIEI
ncbi:MAG: potassium transporter Kup [Betaproteobacteria bacterium]|nr:MAG: potassium transporter Kup [Betaproteobacteria bacterium]